MFAFEIKSKIKVNCMYLTIFITKKTKWHKISVMVTNRPVVWFKTARSSSRAPHRFDSVVMSFDQEALGMGYSKDRIWQPLCDCLHVQFRVSFASLQKVIMQRSQREREKERGKRRLIFFFLLDWIDALQRPPAKTERKQKPEANSYLLCSNCRKH